MKYSELISCEVDKYLATCNFTNDEEQVFKALCKDKSTTQIAFEIGVCERTVFRLKRRIKEKIERSEKN